MNLEYALTVEGFMEPAEMVYLAQVAAKSRRIAEIGSWKGRSACVFAANVGREIEPTRLPRSSWNTTTTGMVFCVDTWQNRLENDVRVGLDKEFWMDFCRNTMPYANIIPVMKQSLDAARLFRELEIWFDTIFIDATHSYEACKADILAWREILMPGGVLFGHDFGHSDWPGVEKAVREVVPKFEVIPNTSIWRAL